MDLIIYGTGKLSKLVYERIKSDDTYNVLAFICDTQYFTTDHFMDKPLFPFNRDIRMKFPPNNTSMIMLGGFASAREREKMYLRAKDLGYRFINFIESGSNFSEDCKMGENNIIFGGCYIDSFGQIGNNNIIRPNVYLGHDFSVGNHNYISPGCNIAGYCKIGNLCFIGIGTTILERKSIADETLVGAHSLIVCDTDQYSRYVGTPAKKIGEHKDTGIVIS